MAATEKNSSPGRTEIEKSDSNGSLTTFCGHNERDNNTVGRSRSVTGVEVGGENGGGGRHVNAKGEQEVVAMEEGIVGSAGGGTMNSAHLAGEGQGEESKSQSILKAAYSGTPHTSGEHLRPASSGAITEVVNRQKELAEGDKLGETVYSVVAGDAAKGAKTTCAPREKSVPQPEASPNSSGEHSGLDLASRTSREQGAENGSAATSACQGPTPVPSKSGGGRRKGRFTILDASESAGGNDAALQEADNSLSSRSWNKDGVDGMANPCGPTHPDSGTPPSSKVLTSSRSREELNMRQNVGYKEYTSGDGDDSSLHASSVDRQSQKEVVANKQQVQQQQQQQHGMKPPPPRVARRKGRFAILEDDGMSTMTGTSSASGPTAPPPAPSSGGAPEVVVVLAARSSEENELIGDGGRSLLGPDETGSQLGGGPGDSRLAEGGDSVQQSQGGQGAGKPPPRVARRKGRFAILEDDETTSTAATVPTGTSAAMGTSGGDGGGGNVGSASGGSSNSGGSGERSDMATSQGAGGSHKNKYVLKSEASVMLPSELHPPPSSPPPGKERMDNGGEFRAEHKRVGRPEDGLIESVAGDMPATKANPAASQRGRAGPSRGQSTSGRTNRSVTPKRRDSPSPPIIISAAVVGGDAAGGGGDGGNGAAVVPLPQADAPLADDISDISSAPPPSSMMDSLQGLGPPPPSQQSVAATCGAGQQQPMQAHDLSVRPHVDPPSVATSGQQQDGATAQPKVKKKGRFMVTNPSNSTDVVVVGSNPAAGVPSDQHNPAHPPSMLSVPPTALNTVPSTGMGGGMNITAAVGLIHDDRGFTPVSVVAIPAVPSSTSVDVGENQGSAEEGYVPTSQLHATTPPVTLQAPMLTGAHEGQVVVAGLSSGDGDLPTISMQVDGSRYDQSPISTVDTSSMASAVASQAPYVTAMHMNGVGQIQMSVEPPPALEATTAGSQSRSVQAEAGVPTLRPLPPALPASLNSYDPKRLTLGNPDVKGGGGFGKILYFLDQMKIEVTEADKTNRSLLKDIKFLREKNKELESRNRDLERRLGEEKHLRETAEAKCKQAKKKLSDRKKKDGPTSSSTLSANHGTDAPPGTPARKAVSSTHFEHIVGDRATDPARIVREEEQNGNQSPSRAASFSGFGELSGNDERSDGREAAKSPVRGGTGESSPEADPYQLAQTNPTDLSAFDNSRQQQAGHKPPLRAPNERQRPHDIPKTSSTSDQAQHPRIMSESPRKKQLQCGEGSDGSNLVRGTRKQAGSAADVTGSALFGRHTDAAQATSAKMTTAGVVSSTKHDFRNNLNVHPHQGFMDGQMNSGVASATSQPGGVTGRSARELAVPTKAQQQDHVSRSVATMEPVKRDRSGGRVPAPDARFDPLSASTMQHVNQQSANMATQLDGGRAAGQGMKKANSSTNFDPLKVEKVDVELSDSREYLSGDESLKGGGFVGKRQPQATEVHVGVHPLLPSSQMARNPTGTHFIMPSGLVPISSSMPTSMPNHVTGSTVSVPSTIHLGTLGALGQSQSMNSLSNGNAMGDAGLAQLGNMPPMGGIMIMSHGGDLNQMQFGQNWQQQHGEGSHAGNAASVNVREFTKVSPCPQNAVPSQAMHQQQQKMTSGPNGLQQQQPPMPRQANSAVGKNGAGEQLKKTPDPFDELAIRRSAGVPGNKF